MSRSYKVLAHLLRITKSINLANLRLRTKILLALVCTTVGLTCSALLFVRSAAVDHVQEEIASSAQDSLLTFQVLLHEHELSLLRKGDLLGTLAAMTGDDTSVLQESADNPLQSTGSDLVVLCDATSEVTTLHSTNAAITVPVVEPSLSRSLANRKNLDWWYIGGVLYQVVLQPIGHDPQKKSGTVVEGRQIDYAVVHDLGRISSGEVAFSYNGNIVVSTFNPLDQDALSQALRQSTRPEQIQIGQERFFFKSTDLGNSSGPEAHLFVLKSYNGATAFLTGLNHLLLGLGFIALISGTGLAIFMSDTFTHPLEKLVKGVQALERGDFVFPLQAHGHDEVAQVTQVFDHMRTTLQRNQAQKELLEAQLRQAQKMEALGRLAGGVAHDFNNLLTVITGNSDLILDRDPLSRNGQQIRKAADRAAALTRQLLAFSRRQPIQPTVLNLNGLVADMSNLMTRLIREDIEFTFQGHESLGRIKADASQMEQVLLNLVVNACDAMPRGGKLIVETCNADIYAEHTQTCPALEAGRYVLLRVTDTGQGMDSETKARIFEPFFTTKPEGNGTGLGLSTVYGVVKQSGGFISVESSPGKGSTFEVYLPRVEENISPIKNQGGITETHFAETGTVLLVEDESGVRALATEFLTSAGYQVVSAEDGVQALDIANKLTEPIILLVTDVVMPKMRGPELARRLRHQHPDLTILYMSGYLEQDSNIGDSLDDGLLLQKPFSRDAFMLQVADVLERRHPTESRVLPG